MFLQLFKYAKLCAVGLLITKKEEAAFSLTGKQIKNERELLILVILKECESQTARIRMDVSGHMSCTSAISL